MFYYIRGKFGNGDFYDDDRHFSSSDDAFHAVDVLEKLGFYDLFVRIHFD